MVRMRASLYISNNQQHQPLNDLVCFAPASLLLCYGIPTEQGHLHERSYYVRVTLG